MKLLTIILFCASGFGGAFVGAQPITVKYDRFKNETIVHVPSEDSAVELAKHTGAPTPMLAVRFEGKDSTVTAKTAAMLFFIVTIRTPADELCNTVDLLVDELRVPRIKFQRTGKNPDPTGGELLASPISAELMSEIIAAKKVEFQLCTQVGFIPASSRLALQKALMKTKGVQK